MFFFLLLIAFFFFLARPSDGNRSIVSDEIDGGFQPPEGELRQKMEGVFQAVNSKNWYVVYNYTQQTDASMTLRSGIVLLYFYITII